jgi:hypothetical protein
MCLFSKANASMTSKIEFFMSKAIKNQQRKRNRSVTQSEPSYFTCTNNYWSSSSYTCCSFWPLCAQNTQTASSRRAVRKTISFAGTHLSATGPQSTQQQQQNTETDYTWRKVWGSIKINCEGNVFRIETFYASRYVQLNNTVTSYTW